jgi:hypothetical protein
MDKIIRLVDRTRTVTDWKCPRARYWGYEYKGRGISKSVTSLELFMGITVHDALAAIATFQMQGVPIDIDIIAVAAQKQMYNELLRASDPVMPEHMEFALEQSALVEGMIRGFYKHSWPRLMELYPTIIAIEQEAEYELYDSENLQIIFMTKPDLVVEDRDGNLVYLEYKTTSSKKEEWVNSWDTAVQLHSSMRATSRTLGRDVNLVQIVGLYKGYPSYGKQSSPFCYAYKKSGNPPFSRDQIEYEYKAGFRRTPIWEMPGGVKAWVESMPENILANQFPMTAPIAVNDDLVDAFFRQRLIREREILLGTCASTTQTDMDTIFPQRFDQCKPYFGRPCTFTKLCHGYVGDPLTEGFTLREPHHEKEREQLGLEGES